MRVTVAPVSTATVAADRIVEIQVEDDDKGMVPDTPFGLGLTGIGSVYGPWASP